MAFRPPITRSLALSISLFTFLWEKEQKECRGKMLLVTRFLSNDVSLLPSHNPSKNKANQTMKYRRISKRANKILCGHGGSSIEMIPIIYFFEGIIAGIVDAIEKNSSPQRRDSPHHCQQRDTCDHCLSPDLSIKFLTPNMNGRHGGVPIFALGLSPQLSLLRFEDTLKSPD